MWCSAAEVIKGLFSNDPCTLAPLHIHPKKTKKDKCEVQIRTHQERLTGETLLQNKRMYDDISYNNRFVGLKVSDLKISSPISTRPAVAKGSCGLSPHKAKRNVWL